MICISKIKRFEKQTKERIKRYEDKEVKKMTCKECDACNDKCDQILYALCLKRRVYEKEAEIAEIKINSYMR